MAILEVEGLSAGYGNGPVIRDISFSVEKGEFVAVLGRNGSGKSTLIKALQNLLKYETGEVRVEGRDIFGLNRREIARKIAYVPQISDTEFEFSVWEIVLMGRYGHQGRLERFSEKDLSTAQRVMELTRVASLRGKKLAHLSGGERQRVLIARALAQETPLLLLDEPSSHLDISFQVEVYQTLKDLQRIQGKTILVAEHNINLAVPYSQRLILLKEGRIERQGEPRALITKDIIKDIFEADVDVRENEHSRLPEISLIPKGMERP
jgi:iron complex transport system ATP-binding protein